jgi:hypothetical protein
LQFHHVLGQQKVQLRREALVGQIEVDGGREKADAGRPGIDFYKTLSKAENFPDKLSSAPLLTNFHPKATHKNLLECHEQ